MLFWRETCVSLFISYRSDMRSLKFEVAALWKDKLVLTTRYIKGNRKARVSSNLFALSISFSLHFSIYKPMNNATASNPFLKLIFSRRSLNKQERACQNLSCMIIISSHSSTSNGLLYRIFKFVNIINTKLALIFIASWLTNYHIFGTSNVTEFKTLQLSFAFLYYINGCIY